MNYHTQFLLLQQVPVPIVVAGAHAQEVFRNDAAISKFGNAPVSLPIFPHNHLPITEPVRVTTKDAAGIEQCWMVTQFMAGETDEHFLIYTYQSSASPSYDADEHFALSPMFSTALESWKLLGKNRRVLKMNEKAQKAVPPHIGQQWKTTDWILWWDAADQWKVEAALAEVEAGKSARFQASRTNAALEKVYWDVSLLPWKQGAEHETQILVCSREVSSLLDQERKVFQANQELEQALAEFRFVTDFMPQMVWATDAEGYHDFYNKRWYEYTGLDYEQTKADGWNLVLHPEDRDRAWKRFGHSLATGEDYDIEYRFRRYDGVYRWFLGRAQPMRNAEGEIVKWFGTCTDIHDNVTAKNKLEQLVMERTQTIARAMLELKSQHEFVENILEASANIIVVLDNEFRFRLLNRKCEEVYGLQREKVIGKSYLELFPQVKDSAIHLLLNKALAGEKVVQSNVSSHLVDGHFQIYMMPLYHDQQIDGVLIMSYDVTALVNATQRLRTANEELLNINSDLTQFAYIASHDLQEPLRKIQTFGDLALRKLNSGLPDVEPLLSKMMSSAQRMSTLVSDLLKYSRLSGDETGYETVDLDALIGQIEQDLEVLIVERNAQISYDHLGSIEAVPSQVNQLFSNLISNGIKFCYDQPVISIVAANVLCTEELSVQYKELITGHEYKHILITDNGIGIEEKYWEKVFVIFQRLHEQGKFPGTGIGLAICRKIVENHHGILHIVPVEKGTRFEMYLPIAQPLA